MSEKHFSTVTVPPFEIIEKFVRQLTLNDLTKQSRLRMYVSFFNRFLKPKLTNEDILAFKENHIMSIKIRDLDTEELDIKKWEFRYVIKNGNTVEFSFASGWKDYRNFRRIQPQETVQFCWVDASTQLIGVKVVSRVSDKPSLQLAKEGPKSESGDGVSDRIPAKIKIAASSLGKVGLYLSHNSETEGYELSESLLKRVNDDCMKTFKIRDRDFSVTKLLTYFCDCVEAHDIPKEISGQDVHTKDVTRDTSLSVESSRDVAVHNAFPIIPTSPTSATTFKQPAIIRRHSTGFSLAKFAQQLGDVGAENTEKTPFEAHDIPKEISGQDVHTKDATRDTSLSVESSRDVAVHNAFPIIPTPPTSATTFKQPTIIREYSTRSSLAKSAQQLGDGAENTDNTPLEPPKDGEDP